MRVGLLLTGGREEKTFLGPSDEPPLVAPLPLPTADTPLTARRPRKPKAAAPSEMLVAGGFGEPWIVLVNCFDIAVSVDSLRSCACRR
jgi:hypothetical protein